MPKYSKCRNYTLKDDGVQVFQNILTSSEIMDMQTLMWTWLNFKTKHTLNPVVKNKKETYSSLFELYPLHGMLFQHWDFGHNPLSWKLRQHPKVIEEFKKVWNTDKLLTSFDGISVSLPCEITKRGWNQQNEWFHTDQCYKRNEFECVQGFVNLFDVNFGDATLRVLRGSHNLHKNFQSKFNITDSSDWHMLNSEEKEWYITELGTDSDICIKAPAGSLVLWDSRTIHQGMEPSQARKLPNIRCVPYICMTPASLASQVQLKKRIKYFEEQRTTNHWPHKIRVFPETPRTRGGKVPIVDKDTLIITPLMKQLVGYDLVEGASLPLNKSKRERFVFAKKNNEPSGQTARRARGAEYPYFTIRAQFGYATKKIKDQRVLFPQLQILLDFTPKPNSNTLYNHIKETLKAKGVVFQRNRIKLEGSDVTEEELIEEMRSINERCSP